MSIPPPKVGSSYTRQGRASSPEAPGASGRPAAASGRGIALGGFMGTGKTTVGGALAASLGWPFVDTDAEIAAVYGPITTQFAAEGEAVFRERERAFVAGLGAGPRVLSTGGGLWVDPENRATLRRGHHLIVLDAPWPVLAARLAADPNRPLAPQAAALYAARRPAYSDADLVVAVDGRSVEAIVGEVLAWLSFQ